MKNEYDFSNAKKNPYAKQLKKVVTIRIDEESISYFKQLAEETGMPYQALINLFIFGNKNPCEPMRTKARTTIGRRHKRQSPPNLRATPSLALQHPMPYHHTKGICCLTRCFLTSSAGMGARQKKTQWRSLNLTQAIEPFPRAGKRVKLDAT